MGLPFEVTAPEIEFTRDSKEILFEITTDKTSPAGLHRNLFCQVLITRDNEPILASTGYSELRIDVPIVKATTPPPPPEPMVKTPPPPTPPTPPKRLTRLEKLRLEQEEREKEASKGGGETPKK